MLRINEIFENKESFKDFALSEEILNLVDEFFDKEETMILIKRNKEIKIIDGAIFDSLLTKKDSSLNEFAELCCIGNEESREDHLKNINYKLNKY